MYRPVPPGQISETLAQLRDLFRRIKPSNETETRAKQRRETLAKNLLSNLSRTNEHPTLHTVLEIAETFSLTLGGAHELFGYDLGGFRECDLRWNRGRTHIIESYAFERDQLVDLPSGFSSSEAFGSDAPLDELVPEWQTGIPIRALEGKGWHQPGAFYIHVGTEDSLGSDLPPGALALVEPIGEKERQRPLARAIYLLQFGNGYRCSLCVVSQGLLIPLDTAQNYSRVQRFAYPEDVRIAGRIRSFALSLPVPDYPLLRSLPSSQQNAPLVLPWEHTSMDKLFAAKHLRFRRSTQDQARIREALETVFHTRLSERTERRYRRPTSSLPHIDALIHLSVANAARYTDSLRANQSLPSDQGRYSLQALLKARQPGDVMDLHQSAHLPTPSAVWEDRRKEFPEWPILLSANFPQLRSWGKRVVRLSEGININGLDPSLSPGSLIVLEKISKTPDTRSDASKAGWSRPLYALRRGAKIFCGYLEREGQQFALFSDPRKPEQIITFRPVELPQLSRVAGVAVPMIGLEDAEGAL
jgi:hypothetical protein